MSPPIACIGRIFTRWHAALVAGFNSPSIKGGLWRWAASAWSCWPDCTSLPWDVLWLLFLAAHILLLERYGKQSRNLSQHGTCLAESMAQYFAISRNRNISKRSIFQGATLTMCLPYDRWHHVLCSHVRNGVCFHRTWRWHQKATRGRSCTPGRA